MYSNILLPVTHDDDGKIFVPMDIAKGLAAEGASITLLHVNENLPAFALEHIPLEVLHTTRDKTRAEMEALAAELPNCQVVVQDGHAGRAISDMAASHGTDLIIMRSHKPGLGDIVWGSTAAYVVRHVACSVHVLR